MELYEHSPDRGSGRGPLQMDFEIVAQKHEGRMDLFGKAFGYLFASLGGLASFVALALFLIQLFTGEADVKVKMGAGPRVLRPLGHEFAFVFFAVGQVFLFVGLGLAASSKKSLVTRFALAIGSGATGAAALAAMVACAKGLGDFGLLLPLVWCTLLAAAYVIAMRHPSYVHSEAMERMREEPPRDEGAMASVPAQSQPTGDENAPTPALLWKRVLIAGLIAWLFPVLFFNAIFALLLLPRMNVQDLFVYVFVAIASVFLGGFFAVVMMVFVYVANKHGKHASGTMESAYREFAARLGGELLTAKVPFFGISIPRAVHFKHGETPTVLDFETVGGGKSRTTYLRITFELPREADLSCQVAPQGVLSSIAALLGAQDVRLGWDVFDDQFVVKTSDENRVGQLLDREVQQELLRLKQFAEHHPPRRHIATGHTDLVLSGRKLQLRMHAYLYEAEMLLSYYEACARIFDRVAPRLAL